FPAGYCCGLLGCCLLRANYNNCANVAMVTVVTCYTSYWFCTSAASTGHLAVMVTGVMMSVERTSLPVDVEKFITDLWKVIMLVMNSTVFLITGMIAPQILAQHMSLKAYFLVFVTYILAFIARFLSFLLFSPFLSRIGYGMSFTNMIVCVWGGLKNPVSLSLAAVMTQIYEDHKASIFFLHSVGVYILALLINGTFFRVLLNLLKLSNLSMARQVNMNNCMKYILQARGRTIAILKMDRFLSDANWPLVTSATTLKHPYKKKFSLDTDDENEEEEEDYFMGVIANLIDFIAMCALCLDLLLNAFAMHFIKFGRSDYYDCLWYILEALRLIQAICFFQLLGFCKGVYPSIIKYLDARIDKYRITAYELGNNYISGEEEILENINAIVDNDKIRDILRSKIDEDRLEVAKVYAICQKDRPWVAITVKTKLVMQAVLSCIRDDINELKTTGWVDDVENLKLQKSLLQRYRQVAAIKSVQPSLPKDIFRAVPWMGHKENVIKFLYENVATKKFDPGDVICREGEVTEGVYILITGLFKLNYAVRKEVISKLNESGILPVADYLSPSKFEENSLEYIIPGNTIGELGVITERPYNCMITAERYSQVFVLSRDVIKQAMEMDSDPINGLECRLWKAVSFRIVVPILMNATAYHSLTLQNLWFTVERSFVPNISSVKVFVVNEMMDDIVLIEGVMVDFNTRDIYTGPCYIPRSVQKLMLPKCSALNIGAEAETKLLIVPAKDFDEYDIMVNEEQICEMVRMRPTIEQCKDDLFLR
ncbi:cNMP binding domain containing protein, partial [Asbolus verrucosus]